MGGFGQVAVQGQELEPGEQDLSEFVARGGASAAPSLAVPPESGRPSADAAPVGSAWDLVADVRQRGGRIVATGGCFDLLHAGHVGLLR